MSCTGLGRLKAEWVEGSCTACCGWLAGDLVRSPRLLECLEEEEVVLKEEEELEVLKDEGSLTMWRLEAGSPLVLTPSCRGGEAAVWAGGRLLDCGLAPGDTNPLEPRLPLLVLVLDTEPCLIMDIDIIDSVDITDM